MSGQLGSDPLFVGLTRPTMILGVSIQYAMLNLIVCITGYIQYTSFKLLLVAMVMHLIGYLLCFKEPRFLEIYLNYFGKCNKCPNKSYYGANSYSV